MYTRSLVKKLRVVIHSLINSTRKGPAVSARGVVRASHVISKYVRPVSGHFGVRRRVRRTCVSYVKRY